MMLALSRRTGKRIGLVRFTMEAIVLVAGIALGGDAGIGTVALALLVGPVVEASFWVVLRLGLAVPTGGEVVEFGPLDAA